MNEVRCKGLHRVEVQDRYGEMSEAVLELKFRKVRVLPAIASIAIHGIPRTCLRRCYARRTEMAGALAGDGCSGSIPDAVEVQGTPESLPSNGSNRTCRPASSTDDRSSVDT